MKKNRRPVLKIPRTPLEIILEIVTVGAIVAHLLLLVVYWPELPDKIPTHFGFSGEVDGWGTKNSLFFLPAVNIGLYIMLTVLSFFPHIFNYLVQITEENAWKQYYNARLMLGFLKALVVLIFAYIEWGSIQVALGNAETLNQTMMISLILLVTVFPLYFVLKSRDSG